MPEIPRNLTLWTSENEKDFFPARSTSKKLPSGYYSIKYQSDTGFFLNKQNIHIEKYIELTKTKGPDIIKDVEEFWESEKLYKKAGFVYKRGILIESHPGNGKTSIINEISCRAIKKGYVVISLDDPDDYRAFMPIIRSIEKSRHLLIIVQKIGFMTEKYGPFAVMDLLDSMNQTNRVVYIATTNDLDSVKELLYNKPNRFDTIFNIKKPIEETRKIFLEQKLKEFPKSKKINITKWAKDTKDFSLANLKELIISVLIRGKDYKKTFSEIKKIKEKVSKKDYDEDVSLGYNTN